MPAHPRLETDQSLADRLKAAFVAYDGGAGMTQKQAAALIGMPHPTFRRWGALFAWNAARVPATASSVHLVLARASIVAPRRDYVAACPRCQEVCLVTERGSRIERWSILGATLDGRVSLYAPHAHQPEGDRSPSRQPI